MLLLFSLKGNKHFSYPAYLLISILGQSHASIPATTSSIPLILHESKMKDELLVNLKGKNHQSNLF